MISIPTYLSNSYFLFQVLAPVNSRFHQHLISSYYYLFLFITDAEKDSDPYISVLCPPPCLSQGHSLGIWYSMLCWVLKHEEVFDGNGIRSLEVNVGYSCSEYPSGTPPTGQYNFPASVSCHLLGGEKAFLCASVSFLSSFSILSCLQY